MTTSTDLSVFAADDSVGFALRELADGAHPLTYLRLANLSLKAHADQYSKEPHYADLLNSAMLGCLAFWKAYINARLISIDENVINAHPAEKGSYEYICAMAAPKSKAVHGADFSKKTDWKALFAHIDDIEHYAYKLAPSIDPLSKHSDKDILDEAEERAFTFVIVDSQTIKDEDDA